MDPGSLSDVEFLHYLASVPMVTFDEGARAVLMARGSTEGLGTAEARRAELERIGAIDAKWRIAADDTLDMGTLAYMLSVVCALKPSVNWSLAEATRVGRRRYALRACMDAELLPYATPRQAVKGGELVTAVTRCTERLP